MDAIFKRITGRLAREDGFSLIELLVAIVLIAIAVTATAATFDHSRTSTSAGERLEAMSHQAQMEIEKIQAETYANTGFKTGAGTAGTDQQPAATTPAFQTSDAKSYVVNSSPIRAFAYDRTNTATTEPFVVAGAGPNGNDNTCTCTTINESSWTNGRQSGTVYRFVTWVNDTCGSPDLCPGTQDFKRITIVVSESKRAADPVIVSTIKRNSA
jgi:prepilin-type N-terminal cleavage/methylation domain-containing protein